MKKMWWFAITMLLAVAAKADAIKPPSSLSVQGTNVVHIGRVQGIGSSNVVFRLKNTGNAPLKITRAYVSCPCLKAEFEKKDVLPGEDVSVTVTIIFSMVKGDFNRGVTLYSDRQKHAEARLFLAGTVIPLVSGLPEDDLVLEAPGAGATFTNTFTLRVNEGQPYRLMEPVAKAPAGLSLHAAMTASGERQGEYTLTTHLTVLTQGVYRASVEIPVDGARKQEPLRLRFRIHGGIMLLASPKTLTMDDPSDASAEQIFRLMVRGSRAMALDPEKLTWSPQLEGMTVAVTEPRRASRRSSTGTAEAKRRPGPLLVTIKLTPAAIQALLGEKEPAVTLSYPGCAGAEVKIEAAGSAGAPAR